MVEPSVLETGQKVDSFIKIVGASHLTACRRCRQRFSCICLGFCLSSWCFLCDGKISPRAKTKGIIASREISRFKARQAVSRAPFLDRFSDAFGGCIGSPLRVINQIRTSRMTSDFIEMQQQHIITITSRCHIRPEKLLQELDELFFRVIRKIIFNNRIAHFFANILCASTCFFGVLTRHLSTVLTSPPSEIGST